MTSWVETYSENYDDMGVQRYSDLIGNLRPGNVNTFEETALLSH